MFYKHFCEIKWFSKQFLITRKIDFFNLKNIITDISENSKNKYHLYVHQYIDYWIEENFINEKMNKRIFYMVSDYCPNDNLLKFIQNIKSFERIDSCETDFSSTL